MPVKGGEKLKERLAAMATLAANANGVKVGFLSGARYPDGTPVAMIGAIQNYGAPRVGIPPRPFFSNMVKDKSPEWPKAMADLLKANNYDAEKTLQQTGAAVSGQLRQSIIDTNTPPLSPLTVARKGFDKPLIDTSHMINSVDFEVKK